MIELFSEVPWWVPIVLAAAVYAVLAAALPAAFPARTAADRVSLARVIETPQIAGLAAGLLLLTGIAGQVQRYRRRRLFDRSQDLDRIRTLRWADFEHWVAGRLTGAGGYQVECDLAGPQFTPLNATLLRIGAWSDRRH